MQLSEVIARARKYMEDVVGGHGNVLTHHKTIKDLEKYYASLGMDNKEVSKFLENVTSDTEGYVYVGQLYESFIYLYCWNLFVVFCICFHGRVY